jgi:hypothetical protein
MKFQELYELTDAMVESGLRGEGWMNLLLLGPIAVAKTSFFPWYAAEKSKRGSEALGKSTLKVGVDLRITSSEASTDTGIPSANKENGSLDFFVPDDVLGYGSSEKCDFDQNDLNISVYDEFTNTRGNVRTAYQQFFLGRELRGRKAAPNMMIAATGNRPKDLSGSTHLEPALLDRFIKIDMEPDRQAWLSEFAPGNIHPCIIAAVMKRADLFHRIPDEKGKRPCTGRGLHSISRLMDNGLAGDMLDAAGHGCIGDAWTELRAYIGYGHAIPLVEEEVIEDPDGAMIPGEVDPSVRLSGEYAIAGNIAGWLGARKKKGKRVVSREANAIIKYLSRLQPEVAVFALKMAVDANSDVAEVRLFGDFLKKHEALLS